MNYNLFSLSKLMQDGWKLSGDVRAMQLTKGQATINFDIVIPTKKGAIYCAYIKRKTNGEVQAGNLVSGSIDAARAHDLLGHSHEDSTKETARYLGWNVKKGGMGKCQSCAEVKAKQKNIPKVSGLEKADT